ncbi:DUF6326 family protein [Thermoproteota archaeon]
MENLKIKLSVLWIFWILGFLVHMFLALFEEGAIEQIIAGEFAGTQITSVTMVLFAVMMLVPLVMAFMSLTLKDKVNRWANVVVGIFYTGLCVFDMIGTAIYAISALSAYTILMYTSHIVVSTLIVWNAYKWT